MRPVLAAAVCVWAVSVPAAGRTHQATPAPTADSGVVVPPDPALDGRDSALAAKVEELRQAVLDAPQSAQAWGRLGWTFMVHGVSPEAVDCLTRAGELDATDMRWPYLAGLTLLRIDRTRARFCLRKAVEIEGDYVPARLHYGRLLAEAGQIAESRAQFDVALRLAPDSWHVRLAAAQAAEGLVDLELALRYLLEAAQLAPEQREVHRSLAHLYAVLNDAQEARQAHARAAALPPSTPLADPVLDAARADAAPAEVLLQQGLAHYQAGRLEEAIAEWERAVEANPDAEIVSVYLGPALVRAGRTKEAIEHYKRALRIAPDNPILVTRTAELLRLQGETFPAIQYYRRALEIQPNAPEATFGLGECLYALGQNEQAVEQLSRALQLDPHHQRGWVLLARAQYDRGRYDAAMQAAVEGLSRFPDSPTLDLIVGQCLQRQGKWANALAALKKAAQAAQDDWVCQHALAQAWLTMPDPELRAPGAALPVARRAAQLAPDNTAVATVLALALLLNGRNADAVTVGERLLAVEPDNRTALVLTGVAHLRLEQRGAARPLIAKARELAPDTPELDGVLAELLAEAERALD